MHVGMALASLLYVQPLQSSHPLNTEIGEGSSKRDQNKQEQNKTNKTKQKQDQNERPKQEAKISKSKTKRVKN